MNADNKLMLISLKHFNSMKSIVRELDKFGNGIACPQCGCELFDTETLLMSNPPKQEVVCKSCQFVGHREL